MQPKFIRIGLIAICLVIVLMLSSNPAMSNNETETVTTEAVNVTLAETQILIEPAMMTVNNTTAEVLYALPIEKRVNYTTASRYVQHIEILPRVNHTGSGMHSGFDMVATYFDGSKVGINYSYIPILELFKGDMGADLIITDLRYYKFKQAQGMPDIYIIGILVKNIGNLKSGTSSISWGYGESCGMGISASPFVPQLTVPELGAGESAYLTHTKTENPECSGVYQGFGVTTPYGAFKQSSTTETDYDNNYLGANYYIPDTSLPYSTVADAIYIKINEIRAKYGKPALTRDSQLDTIAQGHSDAMAQSHIQDHDVGSSIWGNSASGRCKDILNAGFYCPAENIYAVDPAWTEFPCDGVDTTVGDTALGVGTYTVLTWVEHDFVDNCDPNPQGHRKLILGESSGCPNQPTHVGIGVKKGSDGKYYITADFAYKKST